MARKSRKQIWEEYVNKSTPRHDEKVEKTILPKVTLRQSALARSIYIVLRNHNKRSSEIHYEFSNVKGVETFIKESLFSSYLDGSVDFEDIPREVVIMIPKKREFKSI